MATQSAIVRPRPSPEIRKSFLSSHDGREQEAPIDEAGGT
jgi:hypothetical protein